MAAVVAVTVAVITAVTIAQNVGNNNTNTGGKLTNKPLDSYVSITAALAAGIPMSVSIIIRTVLSRNWG